MTEIYKRDTKGRLRILRIEAQLNTVVQSSGLIDGKLVTTRRECKPKNLGKTNATTANEQALLELESLKISKLKEGYFLTKEEALDYINLMPMLATKLDLDKLEYPVIVQPKLDGIRCIATNKQKLSRKNREITTLDHIDLSELPDGVILDGEVYAHGLSFQENTRLVKKYREGETEQIKYHVYDLPSFDGNFLDRSRRLKFLASITKSIELVPSYPVYNEEKLLEYHKQFLQDGYEGTMVRTLDTKYEFSKRSKSLMKMKDFIDEAYEIIDVLPSDKIPTHGVVKCIMKNGQTFSCGMKLSHDEREDILTNKEDVIGKFGEIRFFEFTDSGMPRFPVFYGVRLDK